MMRFAILPVTLSLCALGCAPESADAGRSEGGSAYGGQAGGELADATQESTEDNPPAGLGGSDAAPGCGGVRFQISPNATHRRASAAFAVAALAAGTWPNINRSLLKHEEFLAYFARSATDTTPFARLRVAAAGESVLDVFVKPKAVASAPMHLVLVVDTSTSMRNDLALAGKLVEAFGAALGGTKTDYMSVVEWGGEPRLFAASGETVAPSIRAPELGAAFAARAESLAKGQLGPGASLGPAEQVVSQAMDAVKGNAHVVVITDGGVVADADSFAALDAWRSRQGVVSFVEIAGPAEGASVAAPKSFHREQLSSLVAVGRGLTHFVTAQTLTDLLEDFEGNFRVTELPVAPRYAMNGITQLISGAEATVSPDVLGSPVRSSWAAGRHSYTSIEVLACASDPFQASVSFDDDGISTFMVGDPDDERVRRLGYVDQLFELLSGECEAAVPLVTEGPLAALKPGNDDLQGLVDRVREICKI